MHILQIFSKQAIDQAHYK